MSWFAWAFGGHQTARDAQVLAAEACFTPDELSAIRREGAALVSGGPSGGGGGGVSDAQLLRWCCGGGAHEPLHPALARGLCAAVRRHRRRAPDEGGVSCSASSSSSGGGVSVDDMLVAKARAERQSADDALRFAFDVLDADGAGAMPR
jgi:hypothetical protein